MSDRRIPISQLESTSTAPDASYIAIDDGSLTKKITVEDFNATSTASAQSYAEQAQDIADAVAANIATSAAQIREATLAAREATQASTAATASATSAYDSASLAQNYSVNAATSAGQAMNAADTVAQGVTESKGYAEDSEAWAVGKRNGSDVPSSDDTYHNNAKYYSNSAAASATSAASDADRAEAAAESINVPDTTLTVSGVAADSKAAGDRISSVNSELADIRVKADGTTAATAGDAVREQVGDLKSEIENGGMLLSQSDLEQGSYNSAGATTSNTARIRTKGFIPVEKGGVIRFTPGVTTSNIFYGKFNTNKGFITDGPGWGDSDISIDWDGYVILVFKNATNTTFAPSDYDATTIIMSSVENKAATVAEIAQTENPMNPLLFDKMYFKKGSVISGTEYLTQYEKPAFVNDQFADLNAVSATGISGYIAFRFNAINQPKVLTSGESIDYYAIVKTNKPLTLKPRLSASTTWSGVLSVAVADLIHLSVGYNCVKMHFVYDHTGTSAADNYRFMVFEGNNVFTDLEAEFVFVKGETFLGWVKTLQAAEEEYSTDLLFWGDSLTAGAGGGDTSYPKVCAETLGLSRLNCGVGGESANTIAARQGGNNIIIPVGPVNGSYPISAGFADLFGGIVQPLRQGDGAGSGSKILVNGIECNLANSGGNYVISGYTGTAITTPAIGTFAGNSYTGKVVCIFVGQNGSTFDGLSDYNARIAIIESMIKHLDHNRYVILGLSTGTNASREADDRAMLAKFGNKFFPTRKMLVGNGMTIAGLTPTAQDTTDISNGTVPTSLRSDSVHLNSYGYTALGKMVAEKIVSLGYLT